MDTHRTAAESSFPWREKQLHTMAMWTSIYIYIFTVYIYIYLPDAARTVSVSMSVLQLGQECHPGLEPYAELGGILVPVWISPSARVKRNPCS